MKYFKSLEKTLDTYNFGAVSSDINMFNKDNILVDYVTPYFATMQKMVIYVNDESYIEVFTLTELFTELKNLGFGIDYEVVWSLLKYADKTGEYLIVAVETP